MLVATLLSYINKNTQTSGRHYKNPEVNKRLEICAYHSLDAFCKTLMLLIRRTIFPNDIRQPRGKRMYTLSIGSDCPKHCSM